VVKSHGVLGTIGVIVCVKKHKNNEELQRCELGRRGRPRGPLWASVGASSYMERQKPAWPPEVGAGLEPLGPERFPLMMIESPPHGACNSGPCGVIGLGHRWTGATVWLCRSGTGATVGLGPRAAPWKALWGHGRPSDCGPGHCTARSAVA
jgi:hypothetical protein